MALGRKNVSVARANSGPDIFRLAGLLGNDNLIRHELLAWRIGSDPLEHMVNQLASQATFWPFDSRHKRDLRRRARKARYSGTARFRVHPARVINPPGTAPCPVRGWLHPGLREAEFRAACIEPRHAPGGICPHAR